MLYVFSQLRIKVDDEYLSACRLLAHIIRIFKKINFPFLVF